MLKLRQLFAGVPIFICFSFCIFSCSLILGKDEKDANKKKKVNVKRPTLVLSRFVRISENEQGGREWLLKAREGRFFNKTHKMFLTDFIITFYEKGKPVSYLRARRGIINTRTRNIVALKQVYLRSNNGRTLTTEELYGNMRSKIISNAVFNRITTEDDTVITGTDLYGRNDLKIFKLKNTEGETSESNLSNRQTPSSTVKTNSRRVSTTNG